MAERRPIVEIGGQLQELPAGDSIPGSGGGPVIWDAILQPADISVNQDDYNPTNYHLNNTLRLNPTSNIEITGFDSTNIVDGQLMILHNISASFNVKLKNNNANSLAANRILLKADVTLEEKEAVILQYLATDSRWRLVAKNV